MSRVMMIGDTHFGHKNICRLRTQFSSPEEHDQFILDNILSTIKRRDVLWLLGDIVFNQGAVWCMEEIRKACGNIKLVLGNHDKSNVVSDLIKEGLVDNVYGLTRYKKVWLSHCPVHPDELYGKLCIHGHLHGKNLDDERYINVSCEQIDYKPVNFQLLISSGEQS